jgi:hypothetical protein
MSFSFDALAIGYSSCLRKGVLNRYGVISYCRWSLRSLQFRPPLLMFVEHRQGLSNRHHSESTNPYLIRALFITQMKTPLGERRGSRNRTTGDRELPWSLDVTLVNELRTGRWAVTPQLPCNYVAVCRVDAVERGHFLRSFIFNAISTSRRSASEREGLSNWRSAHSSTRSRSAGGTRNAMIGSRPVAGRPRFFGFTFFVDSAAIFLV